MTAGVVTIGESVRRSSRFEPLRTAVLGAAVTIVVLGLVAIAVILATYAGWDSRSFDRSPRPAELYRSETPRALWTSSYDTVEGVQVEIVYVAPLADDAPLPPGVGAWPRANEVTLSPGLASSLGVVTGEDSRYGRVVGTIGPAGLLEPSERLAYVGAQNRLSPDNAMTVTGFGTDRAAPIGAMGDRKPLGLLLALATLFVLLPSAWFFVTALRVGAPQRARRVWVLTVLGASPRVVRGALWGEARRSWLVGAGVALGVVSLLTLVDLPLPGASFALQARDVRASLPLVAGASLAGLGLTWLGCRSRLGLKGERRRIRSVRLSLPDGLSRWASLVTAALTVTLANIAAGSNAIEAVPVIVVLGTVLTLLAMPSGAVSWTVAVARRAHARAWRYGDAGGMTGTAQLLARPRPAARFGATAAMLVILVCVVFNIVTQIGTEAVNARRTQQSLGESVATVQTLPQVDDAAWHQALGGLAAEYYVGALTSDGARTTFTTRTPEDAQQFESGNEPGVGGWMDYLAGSEVEHRVGAIDSSSAPLLVIAPKDSGPVDLDRIRDILGHSTAPMWNAELPGDSWLVGAMRDRHQARWLTWFGAIGMGIALVTLWVNYTNELLRASRSLVAVQILAPSTAFVRRAIAWRIVAPVGVAVVGGGALALVLSIPPDPAGGVQLPVGFVSVCAALAVMMGVLAWHLTWRACVRAAQSFSLGVPDE